MRNTCFSIRQIECLSISVLCRPGGPSGGIPPDPIPNSAVKAPSAYGTAAQAAGESVAARSAKDICKSPASHNMRKRRDLTIAALFVWIDNYKS